jgi:hypothetical protein
MGGMTDYTYFWIHKFKDQENEVVVSPVFDSEDEAMTWAYDLKERLDNV